MPIALANVLDKHRLKLELKASGQASAVRELVDLLAADEAVRDTEEFLRLVLEREAGSSTIAENGVAFPHARTDSCRKIVLAVGRSASGIAWPEAAVRARLIFLIGVPRNLISDYLVVIGMIARTTKDPALRTLLLHAETKEDFIATMLGAGSI